MKSKFHAIRPPQKPLLIYDGDCNFCKYWADRWHKNTGDAIDYLPLQDPQLATRFPEIPRKEFESAVHFIETDGEVYYGAEAVFHLLAHNPQRQSLLNFYRRFKIFALSSETIYFFVSRNRSFFSWIWGTHP